MIEEETTQHHKSLRTLNDLNSNNVLSLSKPTKGVGGILARLWRVVLNDKNIHFTRLDTLCSLYVQRQRNNLSTMAGSSLSRGNIVRQLGDSSISFKQFIKGLKILEVTTMTISVEITDLSGKVTFHSVTADINSFTESDTNGEKSEDTNA